MSATSGVGVGRDVAAAAERGQRARAGARAVGDGDADAPLAEVDPEDPRHGDGTGSELGVSTVDRLGRRDLDPRLDASGWCRPSPARPQVGRRRTPRGSSRACASGLPRISGSIASGSSRRDLAGGDHDRERDDAARDRPVPGRPGSSRRRARSRARRSTASRASAMAWTGAVSTAVTVPGCRRAELEGLDLLADELVGSTLKIGVAERPSRGRPSPRRRRGPGRRAARRTPSSSWLGQGGDGRVDVLLGDARELGRACRRSSRRGW